MALLTASLIAEARNELAIKTPERIEWETALKWAARALVCFERAIATNDLTWRDRAVTYAHEAVEHAAAAGPGQADAMNAELAGVGAQLAQGFRL